MTQKAAQIVDYIEEKIVRRVECGFCAIVDEDEVDLTDKDNRKAALAAAKRLLKEGWREIDSEEYGAFMLACPDCVAAIIRPQQNKLATATRNK